MTLKQISRMSERELNVWARFSSQKGLPSRRLEVLLARISLTSAQVAGNADLTLDDFLLDKSEPKKLTSEGGAMAIGAVSGVGVRKLGQGRKK